MPTACQTLDSPPLNTFSTPDRQGDSGLFREYSTVVTRTTRDACSARYEILDTAERIGMAYQKGELVSAREKLSLLIGDTATLSTVISKILDFAMIEAESSEPVYERFNITALLHEVTQMGRLMAAKKPITVMDVSTLAPIVIESNPSMIFRIMTELIGNAVKFTDRGRVTIILCNEDELLRLTVADNGKGMTHEQVHALFGTSYRANNTEVQGQEKFGLGLRIVKKLVKRLGGSISAASKMGEGTIVEVTLPLKTMNRSESCG